MSKREIENKSLSPDKVIERRKKYNYPEQGVTVNAKTKEEADEKMKAMIK